VRFLGDLVAAVTISPAVGLNLNVDYVKQGDVNFFGVAAMGHFVLAEHAALSVRGEFIKDKNVYYATEEASIYEGTVGLSLPFAGHYELRPELRGDFSNKEIFSTGSELKSSIGLLAFIPNGGPSAPVFCCSRREGGGLPMGNRDVGWRREDLDDGPGCPRRAASGEGPLPWLPGQPQDVVQHAQAGSSSRAQSSTVRSVILVISSRFAVTRMAPSARA
jgi:hypothetical protein